MTREELEDVVRRALAELRVADGVTLVGVAATPDSDAMTAELRLVAGNRGDVRTVHARYRAWASTA